MNLESAIKQLNDDNLYNHLTDIILQLLLKHPDNPYEVFEYFSHNIKDNANDDIKLVISEEIVFFFIFIQNNLKSEWVKTIFPMFRVF